MRPIKVYGYRSSIVACRHIEIRFDGLLTAFYWNTLEKNRDVCAKVLVSY